MPRWGMVIDLRKCIGCATCREVCDRLHGNAGSCNWRKVIEAKEIGRGNTAGRSSVFLTMSCMHCDDPPCRDACPTGATYCRSDGIVEIQKNTCIGCGACILACPYDARSICTEDVIPATEKSDIEEKTDTDRIGTCTKCNFCSGIIDAGIRKQLKPGEDDDATPLCVRSCIAEALFFGDLDDPESNVSRLIHENSTGRVLEEMDTEPKTYYILKCLPVSGKKFENKKH